MKTSRRKRWQPRVLAMAGALWAAFATGCSTTHPGPADGYGYARGETPAPLELHVVSYNIRHGVGMDGVLDLERTAGVLEILEADVILLQEVDQVCGRSGRVDQAVWLGQRLGMHSRFAPFMDFDGGSYGLAILSRLPILTSRVIALPPGQQEPRSALEVTLDLAGTQLRIANAHLDWLKDDTERLAQAQVLRAALAPNGQATALSPVLLGGDLNDLPGSRSLRSFRSENGGPAPAFELLGPSAPTFPADNPDKTIDHFLIHTSAGGKVLRLWVVAESVASDHRPVALDLRLPSAGM